MKISCLQFDIKWERPVQNFTKTKSLIKDAVKEKTDIVCLPELFSTGVTKKSSEFAEDENGKTCDFLSVQAKENEIYLLGSFIEKIKDDLPRNSTVIYNPEGSLIGKYSKNHVFTYGNEHKYYSNGNGIIGFNLERFKIVPFICYDLRFPEIFRIAVKGGANLFIVTANWPNPRKGHWITLLKARAIENQAYVIGVNRTGASPELSFFGCSAVISPTGKIIGMANEKETVLTCNLEFELLDEWRKTFNSVKDMRENYYSKANIRILE